MNKNILLAVSSVETMPGNIKAFSEAKKLHESDRYELDKGNKVIEFDVEIFKIPGPSRNGIIYEDLDKAVMNPMWQHMMKTGASYGEYDHPLDKDNMNRWQNIDMSKASHKWVKMWMEGNTLMGRVQTFTGNGNLMWHSIKCGELPSFSIRVVGVPKREGDYIRLSNIHLITVDWVRYPGNPGSYVNSSDAFDAVFAPINDGFDLEHRQVAKAESVASLGYDPEKVELVALGEGLHAVVAKVDKNKSKQIWLNRLETL